MGRERDAPRQHERCPQRELLDLLRHLLRPPQRLPLRVVADRRHLRRLRHQRALTRQHRLQPGVEPPGWPLRQRVDCRDGDSVPRAALQAGRLAGVGCERAPHGALEERGVVHPADDAEPGERHLPDLAGRHAGRRRCAVGQQESRTEAVCHCRAVERPACKAGGEQRQERRCRLRREVRPHPEPDRRRHLQHRLRTGGSGRTAGEPHPVPALLPGEARVLPRRAGDLRLRRCGVERQWRRRRRRAHAAPVLQPSHRPQQRRPGADRCRRPPDRQGGKDDARCD